MLIEELLRQKQMSRRKLSVDAGVPYSTTNNLCSGRTKIEKCSAATVYKLASALGVSMKQLTEDGIRQTQQEEAYEHGLPEFLQHDLDAYKEGLKNRVSHLDCLWGELCGSINAAEISGGMITSAHAAYLREKFLYGQEGSPEMSGPGESKQGMNADN